MRKDDELDLLIDAALATYADAGPESELARRVHERIASEPVHAPRRRWLLPAIALPVAACWLFLIFVHPRARITVPGSGQANAAAHLQKPEVLMPRTEPHPVHRPDMSKSAKAAAHNRPVAVLAANAEPLPKLDVFPTPEPLSPQEHALAAFAARTPQAELRALVKFQQQETPPTVASIHVLQLEPPDEGQN